MDDKKTLERSRVMPIDLTYQKLEAITDSFSDKHKVGSGGYGVVYRGVLDNGREIAIKKLHQMVGLDDEQFKKEFNNLMRVQHKNIIRLVGYCYEIKHKYIKVEKDYVFGRMEERALCFEYLEHGSLDKYLSDESCGLDWRTSYEIIKGTCEGLDYLHNGSEDHIYHLDLKPANILLDENKRPKIADFGLSRLFGATQTLTTKKVIGTPGYMPPEYIDRRQISKKFDVFSLGVIIIQIMSGPSGYSRFAGMSPPQFVDLVQENWKKRMHENWVSHTSHEADCLEVKTCIEIAVRCVESDRAKRPTIREVIDELNEIEKVRKSLISKGSGRKLERLVIDPLELRFPFEEDRDVSCVLQLTNRSDDAVAFTAAANQSKYRTAPGRGVMAPWSKQYVVATLQAGAQGRSAPATNLQCDDFCLLRSGKVVMGDHVGSSTGVAEDFAVEDEVRLPIVYVTLPAPPSS